MNAIAPMLVSAALPVSNLKAIHPVIISVLDFI